MSADEVIFDEDRDLVTFTLTGPVTVDDLIRLGDSHFLVHATNRSVWDLRRADLSDIDASDMAKLSIRSRDASGRRQNPLTALIVDDDGKKALLKLYGVIAEADQTSIQYRIVSTMKEALDWLGVEDGANREIDR